MKIFNATQVSFMYGDLEEMIREKFNIPKDQKLRNVIMVSSTSLRAVFTSGTEIADQFTINTAISKEDKEKFLDTPFADMDLSTGSVNCLNAADIFTPRILSTYTKTDFAKFRNFGKKNVTEIMRVIAEHGVVFSPE